MIFFLKIQIQIRIKPYNINFKIVTKIGFEVQMKKDIF